MRRLLYAITTTLLVAEQSAWAQDKPEEKTGEVVLTPALSLIVPTSGSSRLEELLLVGEALRVGLDYRFNAAPVQLGPAIQVGAYVPKRAPIALASGVETNAIQGPAWITDFGLEGRIGPFKRVFLDVFLGWSSASGVKVRDSASTTVTTAGQTITRVTRFDVASSDGLVTGTGVGVGLWALSGAIDAQSPRMLTLSVDWRLHILDGATLLSIPVNVGFQF